MGGSGAQAEIRRERGSRNRGVKFIHPRILGLCPVY